MAVEASTQELERPRVKQSGRHETKFHAQQAISLLAPISKEMSSELNINTIVAQGTGVANNYFFPFAFLVAFDTALRVLTK